MPASLPPALPSTWVGPTPFVTAADGAQIFYKDWGTGRPVIFSHGWPLSSDAWDVELKLLAENGYRAIAHDRRGHGRSEQTWLGNDMDGYVADLAGLVDALDLRDIVVVDTPPAVVRWSGSRPAPAPAGSARS